MKSCFSIIIQGNNINFFPVAKTILTAFLFWDANYKFVLIFVAEGKVLECVFIYITYPYNTLKMTLFPVWPKKKCTITT